MFTIFFSDIQECEIEHHCENGATCVDGIATYTCTCATGYTGTHCEFSMYYLLNTCRVYIYININ